MKNIYPVFHKYRWSIAKIYFYVFLAQLFWLCEPYLLGRAIDTSLQGDYRFFGVLLGAFLMESILIYKRMLFDTKVYIQVYNEIILDYLHRDRDSDSSTKIARTDLAHGLVHFVEHELHYFILSVMTIIGSLYFISMTSPLAALIVFICLFPTSYIVYRFYPKVKQATRVGNTHYEQKIDVLQSQEWTSIETFFKRRKKILVSESTIQGRHWAALHSTKSLFLIAAVVIFTSQRSGLTHGQAVSMYTYISQCLVSLLSIPHAVEVYTRIKDVLSRLKET